MPESRAEGKILVLTDFDGTITRSDTLYRYLLFAVPVHRLIAGLIISIFRIGMLWVFRRYTTEKAKELVLSAFLKGESEKTLRKKGGQFCQKRLPGILRTDVCDKLGNLKKEGATVVIVTASPDIWVLPFAQSEGYALISTRLEFHEGRFTGKLATPNCKGQEKANRIEASILLEEFDHIIGFGNSAGDREMLALAHEAIMV
ncbi:MAG: HAD-IB family hydrolase [Bacteroidota bacterium]